MITTTAPSSELDKVGFTKYDAQVGLFVPRSTFSVRLLFDLTEFFGRIKKQSYKRKQSY